MNTTDFLSIASAICPDRDAMVFEGKRQTYSEVSERANRLGNALVKLGMKQGDRVAMLEVNCPEIIDRRFLNIGHTGNKHFPAICLHPDRGSVASMNGDFSE